MSGEDCIFPFSYKGVLYYQCTTKDFGSIPWCATSVDSYLNVDDWNYCKATSSSSSTGSTSGTSYETAYSSYGSNTGAGTDSEAASGSDDDTEDIEYRALECSKDMASQTLVWLLSPGDPIGMF